VLASNEQGAKLDVHGELHDEKGELIARARHATWEDRTRKLISGQPRPHDASDASQAAALWAPR